MASTLLSKPGHSRRILVLTSTFPRWISDTEPRFVFDLSKKLVEAGFLVDVIAPHAGGAKLHEEVAGINIYRYRYCPDRFQTLAYNGGILANLKKNKFNYLLVPFFLLFQSLAIIRRINFQEYDLIHAHWLIPQAFICMLVMRLTGSRDTPVLCTSHGADLYSLNSPVLRWIKRWTASNCSHLCVVSQTMKKDCLYLVNDESSISVLPMGVDLKNLFVPVAGVERLNHRLIFVGRFVEKKGIEVLIDAMSKVRLTMPSVELILVGDGPLRKNLEDKVRASDLEGNIKFYGSMANRELPELYSSANIAVIPSIVDTHGDREGLGLVTIEALGCGCAVVASALGPIQELVEHGVSGLLFAPGNADALAECLIRLLKEPVLARSLARTGREQVQEPFDWQRVADNYTRLINRFC